ncbi:transglutaminase-like cysteine peptidase [Prosthecomicrobium sp. N25]|uniref:transglutaminase-like cysteine peptidase n=1 Tax=Prosthecomicrobium sp. N25 TaxID=3129254 RepID=UPI003076AC28
MIDAEGGPPSGHRRRARVGGRRASAFALGLLAGLCAASAASADPGFRRATTPSGWADFCKRETGSCAHYNRIATPPELTAEKRAELERVNREVNRSITYVTDQKYLGVEEFWSYPIDGKGDCEDMALLKRKKLQELGWPRSSLLMTVVVAYNGEWHAVLTVETDQGYLVLDNMTDAILPPEQTRHRFFSSQSRETPNRWVMWSNREVAGRTDHRPEGSPASAPAKTP